MFPSFSAQHYYLPAAGSPPASPMSPARPHAQPQVQAQTGPVHAACHVELNRMAAWVAYCRSLQPLWSDLAGSAHPAGIFPAPGHVVFSANIPFQSLQLDEETIRKTAHYYFTARERSQVPTVDDARAFSEDMAACDVWMAEKIYPLLEDGACLPLSPEAAEMAAAMDPTDAPRFWPRELLACALRTMDIGGADLRNTDLSETALDMVDFFGVDLRNASLRSSILNDVKFMHCDMRGCDLGDASLLEATLQNCRLDDAILRGADLSKATLSGNYLVSSDCRSVRLAEAELVDNLFSKADLRHASLFRAVISGGSFKGARMHAAELSGAGFAHCNLQYAVLQDALLRGTYFHHCQMEYASLEYFPIDRTGIVVSLAPSAIRPDLQEYALSDHGSETESMSALESESESDSEAASDIASGSGSHAMPDARNGWAGAGQQPAPAMTIDDATADGNVGHPWLAAFYSTLLLPIVGNLHNELEVHRYAKAATRYVHAEQAARVAALPRLDSRAVDPERLATRRTW